MRSFSCARCAHLLAFENTVCMACEQPQAFDPRSRSLVLLTADPADRCAASTLTGCNWLADAPDELCLSCRLTRTRPNDDDEPGLAAFARAEAAKRRLVYQLLELGLPVVPLEEAPERGLTFDLLSSSDEPVVTGHADGVVTIDLAEGRDAHREAMRALMAEPYRTLLGHLRHEVGHYYWQVLIEGNGLVKTGPETLARFRDLFGDERADYGQALADHYSDGPPPAWVDSHVSAYATAHPWEDWAETFAHYLHIRDTLETAASYGLIVTGPHGPVADADALVAVPQAHEPDDQPWERIVTTWLPLTYALNAVNRSMGKDDLYPFVLSPPAITKLAFLHDLVTGRHTP